jgi:cell division protein ZapE
MEIIHLESEIDYRSRCLREEGTYFWPYGRATAEKAEALFMHLTGGALPVSETLTVKGRNIEVREAAKGCARFSFSQLCEQPHGAEDYIAIAEKYNTVFLENVPSMGYDRRNEAKRLMTLVDALYEAKTKLVITAECDIEHLYYGHDHAFEFKRTISRLLEMQSEAYLGGKSAP